MKCSEWKAAGLALSSICVCVMARGQASTSVSREQIILGSPAKDELIRQIDDPHTGDRWLLMRDRTHPAGPGRLVRAAAASDALAHGAAAVRLPALPEPKPQPIIHRGDRLVLEESTPRVQARLEAIALGPAMAGSSLEVRIVLGGKVVRAVALEPGRVAIAPRMVVLP